MVCWFCGVPVLDPAPGMLVVQGVEVGRICAKHAPMTSLALKGLAGFRHFARVWIENRAAKVKASQPAGPAGGAARGLVRQGG